MFVEDPPRVKDQELEQALRLSVRGYTSSYYVKQLALAAVREVYPSNPVDLDIQVTSVSQPYSGQGGQSSWSRV